MSKSDWYSAENWYAPLYGADSTDTAPDTGKKKKKKKRTAVRVIAGIVLMGVLIAATSFAFREEPEQETVIPGFEQQDDMPVDWKDFLDNYYTSVNYEVAEIDIERTAYTGGFLPETERPGGSELALGELFTAGCPIVTGIAGYTDGKDGYNWGTGFILSADGLIATNTHIIEGCDRCEVILNDDTVYEAKLIGADTISDIAVLKIEAQGLPTARLADTDTLAVGDRVAAIGNPLGKELRLTFTDGIVSAIERGIKHNGHSMTLIQTNTALNQGNSGGPLFNMYGQVIGITNMKMMSSYETIEGIGFAIPSVTVRSVTEQLIRTGEVRGRTSLGITVGEIPENIKQGYNVPAGLYVMSVSEGSDAVAKGIVPGDIIISANGQPVETTDDVAEIKDALSVGDSITLMIWRDGESFEVDIILKDTLDIYG